MTTTLNPWTDRYDKLGIAGGSLGAHDTHSVATLVGLASVQQAYTPGKDLLNSMVSDSGRVVIRANTVTTKKESAIENDVDSLAGATKYTRPNGEDYYTRKWGDHDDVMVLREARTSKLHTMLYGAPGCGKTALLEAAFSEEPGGIETVLGTGDTELSDFIGGYVQDKDSFRWVDGPLVRALENDSVFFIDEVGLIDPKVMAGVYGIMDGRTELLITANPDRGAVKVKDNFFVVAATNPNAPGVRLSEALLSRFRLQSEMTTDWTLARKLGTPVQLVNAAQNLARKQQASEVSWAPQMRELLAFRDISIKFGTKFALANLIASAPEHDRAVVADVLGRVYGEECRPAKI